MRTFYPLLSEAPLQLFYHFKHHWRSLSLSLSLTKNFSNVLQDIKERSDI